MPLVSAPHEEGVVEDACVLVDDAVEFGTYYGRGPDNHCLIVIDVTACCDRLFRERVVVATELSEVVAVRYVAVADASLLVIHDHVDAQTVEAEQLAVLWQQVELRNLAGCFADAPAQEHVELQALPPARLQQARHVEGLDERHHRHGRLHPEFKSLCPAGFFGVDFLFHYTLS